VRTRTSTGARLTAALIAGAVALAGCASGSGSAEPTWKPKPSFSGEGNVPDTNPPSGPANPAVPPGASPSPSTSGKPGDGAVVATKLRAPTGVAILPDNTALVGERTTGRIVRVQPQPNRPVQTVRTIAGISTVGGGGLLDLAISPNYSQDNLIFGYVTTKTDNRVIAFTLHGPVTPVLVGIPRGPIDNTGRIAFAPDGTLYVGTGDAGQLELAAEPHSLAGKILHITDIGKPAPGNPIKGSPVFARGNPTVAGLCIDADAGTIFSTEPRGDLPADPVYQVQVDDNFGFPPGFGAAAQPLASLPPTSPTPGGCAVLAGNLYVTSLDGHALLGAAITTSKTGTVRLGAFSATLHNRYGRLRTVVAAPDGALWLTTSNRDGQGNPVPTDERVLRIVPNGGGGGSSTV
jgi:glucose/arabinose dehydrogenase